MYFPPNKTNETKMQKNVYVLLYVSVIAPFAIALFLYGFFPMVNYDNSFATMNDIPEYVRDVRIKKDSLYQPMVSQLVIMVIDALRWDFINGPIGKIAMPMTTSLISKSSACLLETKVQSPTVTMPRIKAITSGSVPGFIDVVLNFGNKPLTTDNILFQAKRHGHKLVFYGDDTWLKLFPNTFHEHDGTTSFVVTDFTGVDNNVTRHIHTKLNVNSDWNIMILHYLGLDHIGHVHGPFSPLIISKLQEMDRVIMEIQSKIQQWNENGNPALFVICGDHGMKDSGGHGGSTIAETTVPFVTIGGKCHQKPNEPAKIAQIDIASTLSGLLGVPIPLSNIGSTFLDTIYDLPISQHLFILYYNAKQVMNHFKKLPDYKYEDAYYKYEEAVKLHAAWLNTRSPTKETTDDIIASYKISLKQMKEKLLSHVTKYDYHTIIIATVFVCQIFLIALGRQFTHRSNFKRVITFIVFNKLLIVAMSFILDFELDALPNSANTATTIILKLLIWIVLISNCTLLANIDYRGYYTVLGKKTHLVERILFFGTLVHSISLGGSSFVEEEHQTWYFYFVTLLIVLLCAYIASYFDSLRLNRKNRAYGQSASKLLWILICHRILRKLNSTGDKYAYLPDISGWLKEHDVIYMTFVLVSALALLIWIDYVREDRDYRLLSLILNIGLSICIYIRHMRNNAVIEIPWFPRLTNMTEVYIFWYLFLIYLTICNYRLVMVTRKTNDYFVTKTLFFGVKTWVIVAALLHQPYNVILLPLEIIFTSVISSLQVNSEKSEEMNVFVCTWIGNTFYFYQGNSNSLATIDVAAGYVGFQSYLPFLNGTLMLINTYSAPVLSYLLLMYFLAIECKDQIYERLLQTSKFYIAWRLLPVTVYTVIISIQRHHLFIWTVFSPKLLYEAVHSTVICFIALLMIILTVVNNSIKKKR